MKKVIGICNLHDAPKLGLLTESHPLGAVSYLGRYALMDFALSNFSNSRIDKVCILVKDNITSIHNHLRSGAVWVNNTKTGFQKICINEKGLLSPKFNTDINNILANHHIFEDSDVEYFVVAPTFFIMSCDYSKLVEAHKASGADITVLYRHATDADVNYQHCDELTIDPETGLVNAISPFPGNKQEAAISLETFVFNKAAFNGLCLTAKDVSSVYMLRRMVRYAVETKLLKLNSYKFDGYVAPMLTLQDYFRHSLECLKRDNHRALFLNNWPILTTTHNTQPALYGPNCVARNSFIANGAIIKGTVKNSIISRDVIVEEGAVVENSILFNRAKVGKGVHVNYVLGDKNCVISECKEVSGKEDEVLYISQGVKI